MILLLRSRLCFEKFFYRSNRNEYLQCCGGVMVKIQESSEGPLQMCSIISVFFSLLILLLEKCMITWEIIMNLLLNNHCLLSTYCSCTTTLEEHGSIWRVHKNDSRSSEQKMSTESGHAHISREKTICTIR